MAYSCKHIGVDIKYNSKKLSNQNRRYIGFDANFEKKKKNDTVIFYWKHYCFSDVHPDILYYSDNYREDKKNYPRTDQKKIFHRKPHSPTRKR